VLRSQTDRLQFLRQLRTQLTLTAFVAVLAATLLSYAIARTVTRPVETITSTMREMAASGDLSRRIPVPEGRWQDEDARVLATTFNTMTDSIARFQREGAQARAAVVARRLSTVIAHEIRNPLMIIKTSLRSLRREDRRSEQVRGAAKDIDEEITRLNRIVTEVLDFARPIRFDLDDADANALVEDAIRAATATAPDVPVRADLDRSLPPVTTDAGRLRQALVNVIGNAVQAVDGAPPAAARTPSPPSGSRPRGWTPARFLILIADKGTGISPEDLPRIFDPFFTTRRTGTGIGLAISRNIIEGLGGRSACRAHAIAVPTYASSSPSIRESHDQNYRHDPSRRRRNQDPEPASRRRCAKKGTRSSPSATRARPSACSPAAASTCWCSTT
jgi:signal transduction histidine kinase